MIEDMFNQKPIREVNNVLDFIGENEDDYIVNYEEISEDYGGFISIETSIFGNLCNVLFQQNHYGKVLDVGCGTGYVLNHIMSKERVGVDISLNELTHVMPGITAVRAYGESMPFELGYFDAVLCFDLLEHVLNPHMLAQELTRVLKVGGSLFLACPWNQDLSVYELDEFKRDYKQYKYRHQRSIDQELIHKLFGHYREVSSTMVTAHTRFMRFTPYPIKFMHLILKEII